MTIQQLRCFLAVCRHLNYTAAGKECYMSRQAIRQSITALEKEVYGPLFESHGNHLSLTPKGILLKKHAEPVMKAYEQLEQAMNADLSVSHPVRIAISTAVRPNYLPDLNSDLKRFEKLYPGIHLSYTSVENDRIAGEIGKTYDCGILLDMNVEEEDLQRRTLTKHPAGLTFYKTHPFFARKMLTAREIGGCRLSLPGFGKEFSPVMEIPGISCSLASEYFHAYYLVRTDNLSILNRCRKEDREEDTDVRTVPLKDYFLCSSFLCTKTAEPAILRLGEYLQECMKTRFPESL